MRWLALARKGTRYGKVTAPGKRHPFYAPLTSCFSTLCFLTPCFLTICACELLPRPGDTQGEQVRAEWRSSARLIVNTDPHLTLVRIGVDTTGVAGRHDVLLTKFEFGDPADGSAYELTLGLDFGDTRTLTTGKAYSVGGPRAQIPAVGSVACLCHPIRPDSVRGSYELERLGIAQITGHVDVTLYFTAWDDPSVHTTYRLKQRIEGVK